MSIIRRLKNLWRLSEYRLGEDRTFNLASDNGQIMDAGLIKKTTLLRDIPYKPAPATIVQFEDPLAEFNPDLE